MIPPRNLSLLSNRLALAGGRRIPEAVLERDYCLAWFLAALASTPLRERLAFKGGTALKQCYFTDFRFSEDLDFTLTTETPFEHIRQGLDRVFADAQRASGIVFRFAREDPNPHANSHTFYLGYDGPLPAPAAGREVKVDITIREHLVFPLGQRPILRGYEGMLTYRTERRSECTRLTRLPPRKWSRSWIGLGTNRAICTTRGTLWLAVT